MIDYEKLRLAHQMCHAYYVENDRQISIELNFLTELVEYILYIGHMEDDAFSNIDDLITKLESLIQPKPKYEVGQEVWFIDCTLTHGPVSSAKHAGERNNT